MGRDERLIQVLGDAYANCIVGGMSREYNMIEDGLVFEVGTIKELQVINPSINQSIALNTTDGRYVVCIAKENVLYAPEEYRLKMLLFIALHEIGHIINKDEWETREAENLVQEKRADTYALKTSGIDPEDAAKCIEILYNEVLEESPNKSIEFRQLVTRVKSARIDNILKNKGCA